MEKAAVMWSRVLLRVVPAWSMEKATHFTLPQNFPRAAMRGVFFNILSDLVVATKVFTKADLDEDEGALCPVALGRVWRSGV